MCGLRKTRLIKKSVSRPEFGKPTSCCSGWLITCFYKQGSCENTATSIPMTAFVLDEPGWGSVTELTWPEERVATWWFHQKQCAEPTCRITQPDFRRIFMTPPVAFIFGRLCGKAKTLNSERLRFKIWCRPDLGQESKTFLCVAFLTCKVRAKPSSLAKATRGKWNNTLKVVSSKWYLVVAGSTGRACISEPLLCARFCRLCSHILQSSPAVTCWTSFCFPCWS